MKHVKNEKPESTAHTSDVNDNMLNVVVEEHAKSTKSNTRYTKRPPNERRFKCDDCERMFFTRKDVKRHSVVHTGVRNFACPFCQQRFGRKDHLVRHAKKSHNRDTRTSATYTVSSSANRRGNFAQHSTAPLPPIAMQNTSPTSGDNLSHSPCNYSTVTSPVEQPSFLLLGSSNGHNSNVCCNASNAPSGALNVAIGETGFASTSLHPIEENKHGSGCEPLIFNNGSQHYFSFPMSAPSIFMGPTYISSGYAPNASSNNMCTNNGGSHPVGGLCTDHSPVASTAFDSHDVSSSLPHFNQIFQ